MADYSIHDLADAAGMTVRNVRAYRDKGLLAPPRRDGRHALYSDAHLTRLHLIGTLLDRGYTLNNIAELIETWEEGRNVGDLLGLTEKLTTWTDEIPGHVTIADLVTVLGAQLTPSTLRHAEALGVLEPDGDGYRVRSPSLIAAGAELVAAGLPLEAVLAEWTRLREDIDRVARGFVALITTHLIDPMGDMPTSEDVADIGAMVDRLRPLAHTVVSAELSLAMERQVQEQLGERLNRILAAFGVEQPGANPAPDAGRRPRHRT